MALRSPLLPNHEARGAGLMPYGPPESGVLLADAFGPVEFEYAALRKGCVLFDAPHRATIELTGTDRLSFLQRMITQDVGTLAPLTHRNSFWLNRKGRIVADLRVLELGDATRLDLDCHAAAETLDSLRKYVITEDVTLHDRTPELHRLGLHGPTAAALLDLVTTPSPGCDRAAALAPGRATRLHWSEPGVEIIAERLDPYGEPGFELTLPAPHVEGFDAALRAAGEPPELDTTTGQRVATPTPDQARIRLRLTGWLALNVARIEAGTPLFNLDFGPANLPAETGVLRDHVSFKKGCYLGQEVVARMDALGKPKQVLVALRLAPPTDPASPTPQPGYGARVFELLAAGAGADACTVASPAITHSPIADRQSPPGDEVGAVTSSTISPMLAGAAVCFAQVKTRVAEAASSDASPQSAEDTRVLVEADGALRPATLRTQLAFWTRP